jgi:type II secretory pathway pseudopilin PulG
MKMTKRKNKGFTIPEVLVSTITFVILSTIILSSFVIAMRFMNTTDKKVAAHNICQGALDVIISEIRQAVPNLDTGYGNTPSGYLRLSPPVSKTAILMPNQNVKTAKEIIFTEPAFNNTDLHLDDPTKFKFEKIRPETFQLVRYFVNTNGQVVREVRPIGTNSQYGTPTTTIVAEAEQGIFELDVTYVSPRSCEIRLRITRQVGANIEELASYSSLVTVVVE